MAGSPGGRFDDEMTAADTIFALSSGAGRAAVALIRVSGGRAGAALEALTGRVPSPRQASLRKLSDPATGDILDEALVLWLPGPGTATGEDMAELHLHGSPAVIAATLKLLARLPGLRPADPGEFTRRAFGNGKVDLVQVEGLGDLLEARTAVQRRQAYRQMSGRSSSVFEDWRRKLLLIRADLEAAVDFVDEADVADRAIAGIDKRIRDLVEDVTRHIARSESAEIIRNGVRVVLAGRPNTGKSSLLNALAQREAAIVSNIPGTTRDAIEISMDIGGLPVILTDTAGLRTTGADIVEQEGIRRSFKHIAAADVLLWVVAPDVPGSDHPDSGLEPDLVVLNKSDLLASDSGLFRNELGDQTIWTSTVSEIGIKALLDKLESLARDRFGIAEPAFLVSVRQKRVAEESIRFLNEALAIPTSTLELKAEAVRRASEEIGRLTGRIDVEEWLGAIFSRFCIGK